MDICLSTQVVDRFFICHVSATGCIAPVTYCNICERTILMANLSRRNVLILAAAGAAEIGALAASAAAGAHFAPVSAATTTTQNTANPKVDMSQGPLAAFVTDAKAGTIVIMRGEQEITITDPTLVRALLSFSSF